MDTVKQLTVGKFYYVKRKFCFVNAKYSDATILRLHLGFILPSHTSFFCNIYIEKNLTTVLKFVFFDIDGKKEFHRLCLQRRTRLG